MILFETARIAAADVVEDDLAELLEVYVSNPAYLELTEGSAGMPGHHDRGMLERDLAVAAMTPGWHVAALRLRESGECIGLLDWMDENPADGCPWLGLVMVHAGHQRRGLAEEAVRGLVAYGLSAGWANLREAMIEGNAAGLALARAVGMHEVERPHPVAAGEREVVVMELAGA
jgi:RimJ/RimL family protein N-acetyltransferase